MKRILLVPSPHVVDQGVEPYLPLGLFSLQAVGAELGDAIDVLDLSDDAERRSPSASSDLAERVVSRIEIARYDVIGLSTTCSTFHNSLLIAGRVKNRAPRVSVWMGGPQASAVAADLLRASDAVDAVFVGESEVTLAEVLARRVRGVPDLAGIPGIHTRNAPYSPRRQLKRLDQLPLIDVTRGFLAAMRKAKLYHFDDAIPIEATRGCTGRCAFCSTRQFWGGGVRRKSDARLVEEMRRLHAVTGRGYFNLMGDNFAAPRPRLLGFCSTMARDAADFRWVCNLRLDRLRPADLDALWKGGCRGFFVGVESASQETLDRIGKGVVLDDELEVIRRAVAMGFRVETSLMVGFPWETRKDLNRTFELHCRLLEEGVFRSAVWVLCPLPGTEFARDARRGPALDAERSGIARDDLPLDATAARLIANHPMLFPQFYRCETPHLRWADLAAVADASLQFAHAFARKWDSVPLPA